jgi:hypothetical protein
VSDRGPRYSREEATHAIAASSSWAETLRRLGMCVSGGANHVLRKYARIWDISTEHFDPHARQRGQPGARRRPLSEVLVQGSSYGRASLKQRLYRDGLKQRRCELCGQGETWHGREMALILDHVNGVADDNRLENLRIVCPNCNATLDTHCGRNARIDRDRMCVRCGAPFRANYASHRYCSTACGHRFDRAGVARPGARRAERPPIDELLAAIAEHGYEAVGRRHGVSGTAIRKWVLGAGADPPTRRRAVRRSLTVPPPRERDAA